MALIITSPVSGSLRVQNSAASPQVNYMANLQTINVSGDPFYQTVNLANELQQTIASFPVSQITRISASTQSFSLAFAVDAIATLIMK